MLLGAGCEITRSFTEPGLKEVFLFVADAGDAVGANQVTFIINGTDGPLNRQPDGDIEGNETVEVNRPLNLTANYTDPDGDALTVEVLTGPAHGTFVAEGDGYRYTPGADFNGSDTVTYRITDAEGKPYSLGVIGGSGRPNRARQTMTLTLELHPEKDGHGPPAVATFWGTYTKPVEVPVVLRDVPLSNGK